MLAPHAARVACLTRRLSTPAQSAAAAAAAVSPARLALPSARPGPWQPARLVAPLATKAAPPKPKPQTTPSESPPASSRTPQTGTLAQDDKPGAVHTRAKGRGVEIVPVKIAKPKKPKRLNPPKRITNTLQLILQDVVAEYKEKLGKVSTEEARQCMQVAVGRHSRLTPKEKEEYERRLAVKRAEHTAAMQTYLASLTPSDYINEAEYLRLKKAQGQRQRRRSGLPKFDPNAPKRPLNGYLFFLSEAREGETGARRLAEWGVDEIAPKMGGEGEGGKVSAENSRAWAAAWRALPEAVREGFMLRAKVDMDRYVQEKAAYDARATEDEAKRQAAAEAAKAAKSKKKAPPPS